MFVLELPKMIRILRWTSRAGTFVGAGLVAVAAFGATRVADREPEPLAGATLSAPGCVQPRGNDAATKVFFKLAAAKTEVRPFQPVPDAAMWHYGRGVAFAANGDAAAADAPLKRGDRGRLRGMNERPWVAPNPWGGVRLT